MEKPSVQELRRMTWQRHPLSRFTILSQLLMSEGPDYPSEMVLFFSNGQSIPKKQLEEELQAIYDELVFELRNDSENKTS